MWKNYRVSDLTAETTVEEIMEPVESLRKTLLTVAVEGTSAQDLQYHLNNMASAEGQASIALKYVMRLEKGLSREAAVLSLADEMAGKTADDKWSGRRNDVNRSYYDGEREMFGELFSTVISFNDEFLARVG